MQRVGLDDDRTETFPTPLPEHIVGEPLKKLWAGENQTCGLNEEDELLCWGVVPDLDETERFSSVITLGTMPFHEPLLFDFGSSFVTSMSSNTHSCALLSDGMVRCWGGTFSPEGVGIPRAQIFGNPDGVWPPPPVKLW